MDPFSPVKQVGYYGTYGIIVVFRTLLSNVAGAAVLSGCAAARRHAKPCRPGRGGMCDIGLSTNVMVREGGQPQHMERRGAAAQAASCRQPQSIASARVIEDTWVPTLFSKKF